MALVAVVLLPLGGLSVWSAFNASRTALAQAQDQLTLAATLVAAQQDRRADAAQHLLAVITAVPEIRSLDRQRCQSYMESLRGRYPIYGNIGILDLKGDLICHAADRQGRFNAADRRYFRDAVETRAFTLGELVIGRTLNRPLMTFALPVIQDTELQAVAFAGVDIGQMQADLNQLSLPQGVRLAVLDEQGRLLIERDADGLPVRPPGTPVSLPELREAARAMKPAHIRGVGRDGSRRLIAVTPAEPVGSGRLLALASMDEARITAAAWERAVRELAILGIVLVASLVAAWQVGSRMISRPAAALERVAGRLAGGDLDARVDGRTVGQGDEFSHIASTLNLMAQRLQERQRQLVAELEKTREANERLDDVNRTLEQRVAEATQELRQSNRELEAFSYSVSHDLRAPLAAVDGFTLALAERLGNSQDEKVAHYIARIRAGAHQMEELIQALLQLARLTREPMAYEAVDLSSLAREILEGLRLQAPSREVATRVQDGLVAPGDPRMLRTVLHNLLGNAWKFTGPSEAATIEVGRRREGARQVFYVKDNGVGFDMARAARLFTPFQRLHANEEFPGTGIGLATVQRVIERHGGRIWAQSAPGQGCTVFFTLPEPDRPDAGGVAEGAAGPAGLSG